jgi:integrase
MKERAFVSTSLKPEDWETEAETERETYLQGKDLIESFGRADPTDAFALDCLGEHLSNDELKAYVFAWDHDEQHRQNKRRDTVQRFAQAMLGSGLLTRPPLAPHDAYNVSCDNDAALQEAITRFLSAGVRTPATIRSYRSRLTLFQHIIEAQVKGRSPRISQITPEMIRQYADHVRRLPKNFQIGSGVKLASALVEPGTGISPKTIALQLGVVRSLLLWLEDQQYPIAPRMARIFGTLKVASKRKRFPFERQELKLLLESSEYLSGSFKRAGDYWVPLIGLFTGARESEICQLHTSDILKDEETGLWVFYFNADDDKRQKTNGSERKVPIHPTLQKLGFITYAEQMRSASVTRLFPDEERNARGEFASFSKRFNRYRQRVGIDSTPHKRKDFHSFRHNVSDYLAGIGCEQYVINAITGHSQARESHAIRTYSSGPSLETVNRSLKRLDYGIEFSKIRQNGWKKSFVGKQ